MKNFFTALFSLLLFNLQAQIEFEHRVIVDETLVPKGPSQAFAADMDGDGDKDILAISILDEQVNLYDNINGNLSKKIIIPSNAGDLRYADLADLDGDGDQDVLLSKKGNFVAYWLQNLGGGNFQVKTYPYNIIGEIEIVKAADMDNDGDMDIVAARDTRTYWFRNTDGNGTFEFVDDFASVDDISAMEVADIDANGFPDLIYASEQGSNLTIAKNTNGSFSSSQLTTSLMNADAIAVADLDNDGDMDLAIGSSQAGAVAIARNVGGDFSTVEVLSNNFTTVYSVAIGDINNDNQKDIVALTCEDGLFAFYNQGGNFASASFIAEAKSCASNIFIDDIDDDGDNDLMSCSIFDNRVSLYYTENGTIGREQNIASFADRPNKVVLADLDNDGDTDVISSSADDDKISWFTNLDAKGRFGHLRVISENLNGASDVYAEDADGDGRLDVFSASRNDDKITWFQNLGGQHFFSEDRIITNECDGASEVKVVDLDQDGQMDVIYACELSNTLAWRKGVFGASDFGPENILSDNIKQVKSIAFADVDGDGDVDVFAAAHGSPFTSSSKVYWFENTGNGNFTAAITIDDEVPFTDEIHILDYEGDGDLDILVVGSDMRWYENQDGQGNWSDAILVFPISVRNVYPHDMDGDGDQDLVMVVTDDTNPHGIWTFDNGSFTLSSTFTDDGDPIYYAAAGDVDQDGDQDLVTCGIFFNGADLDDHVKWMDNRTITTSVQNYYHTKTPILAYPNPVDNWLYLHSDEKIKLVELRDVSGRLIASRKLASNRLDCSVLAQGLYFCKILLENDEQQVIKFVKQ